MIDDMYKEIPLSKVKKIFLHLKAYYGYYLMFLLGTFVGQFITFYILGLVGFIAWQNPPILVKK